MLLLNWCSSIWRAQRKQESIGQGGIWSLAVYEEVFILVSDIEGNRIELEEFWTRPSGELGSLELQVLRTLALEKNNSWFVSCG